MTPHTAIDNNILEVYHKADSSIGRIMPALFIPQVRSHLLNILVLCILGASLPSAQAMSDGKFPGKGSKTVWTKASNLNNAGNELRRSGKAKESIPLYLRAIALYPGDSVFYYNIANAYADLKDFKQSESNYKKAIALEPGYYSAWYNMGVDLFQQGSYKESQKAITKAAQAAKTEKQKSDAAAYLKALSKKLKRP